MNFPKLFNTFFRKNFRNNFIYNKYVIQFTSLLSDHWNVRNLKSLSESMVNFSQSLSTVSFCDHEKEVDLYSKLPHIPVLAEEAIKALHVKENGVYLDMTFGAGGHTKMILKSNPSVIVYGLDRDPSTNEYSSVLKEDYPDRFFPLIGKFSDLPELLYEKNIGSNFFNGVLMDLGASSIQFNTPERGFMLSKEGPLDMRMDGNNSKDGSTASEILKYIDENSLYLVLKYYGQEKKAKAIARAIIESRSLFKSLRTTKELGELVIAVTGEERRADKLQRYSHPATKTFQALRILVNDELNQLDYGIRLAHFFLETDGILAAISFHSLEDTILKRHFTGCDLDKTPESIGKGLQKHYISHLRSYSEDELAKEILKPWNILSKHVITPSEDEIESNPRARSAKLRYASKVYGYPY